MAGYFAIIVLHRYCYYKCYIALSHGAMDWSAVCDCGISSSYSLTFYIVYQTCNMGAVMLSYTTMLKSDVY